MECVLWIAGGLFTAALTYVGFCAAIMAVLHSPAWSVRGSADQDFYDLLCAPARGLKLIKRKRKPMKQVTIYTDGGVCLANPVNANSLASCGATARMAGTRRLNGGPQ